MNTVEDPEFSCAKVQLFNEDVSLDVYTREEAHTLSWIRLARLHARGGDTSGVETETDAGIRWSCQR